MTNGYLRYPHVHGDLITFVAGDDVWLADASGGRAWRLSADGTEVSYPRFSRDGTSIAWTSWRDGNPEVYACDVGGGDAVRLTFWGDPETRVTGWTADGEVLAVSAAGILIMTDAAWLLDRADRVPDLFVDVMESGERKSIVEVGGA